MCDVSGVVYFLVSTPFCRVLTHFLLFLFESPPQHRMCICECRVLQEMERVRVLSVTESAVVGSIARVV